MGKTHKQHGHEQQGDRQHAGNQDRGSRPEFKAEYKDVKVIDDKAFRIIIRKSNHRLPRYSFFFEFFHPVNPERTTRFCSVVSSGHLSAGGGNGQTSITRIADALHERTKEAEGWIADQVQANEDEHIARRQEREGKHHHDRRGFNALDAIAK